MESKWALHEGHPRVTVLGSNLHNVLFLFDIDHKVTIAFVLSREGAKYIMYWACNGEEGEILWGSEIQ
jgi:hypothetical protein